MFSKINKNWFILIVALVVGGFAAFGTKNYIKNKMEDIEAQNKKTMVSVVVAKKNLGEGTKLSADNLAVREVPQDVVHSGAVMPEEFSRVDGGMLVHPAVAGEPLIWAQLENKKAETFSTKLAVGRRAVTVPVDEISSISGMVQPGDLIDIVVSTQKDSRNITFTLLQSVRVLATGAKVSQSVKDDGQMTYTTVTLDTTPEDAKRLIAAREIGRITALLRSPEDGSDISTERVSAEDLLGLGSAPVNYGLSSVPVIYGGGPIKDGLHMNPSKEKELDDLAVAEEKALSMQPLLNSIGLNNTGNAVTKK